MAVEVSEGGGFANEYHLHRAGLPIAVFGNDQLGESSILVSGIVHLFAVDEGNHIRVLLDASAFAEVGKLRTVVASTSLRIAGELGQCDHRDLQLFGELLESTADSRDLKVPILVLATCLHELEVIKDEQREPLLRLQATRLGGDLQERWVG